MPHASMHGWRSKPKAGLLTEAAVSRSLADVKAF